MTIEHVEIQPGEIHAPHHWRVPDAVTREALAVTAAELGMYAWQQDDDSQWLLTTASPPTWKQVGGDTAGALLLSNAFSEFASDPAAQAQALANLGIATVDGGTFF